jgi:uncharacterized protein (DUF1697 family)
MPIYIALLRGINVSGQKLIGMEALRATFAALGFHQVKTYVQSGNVVFETATTSPVKLAGQIERQLLADYGFEVPVLVKTATELAQVAGGNPLAKAPGIDAAKLHVTFLAERAPAGAASKLQSLAAASEQFQVLGREVYLCCPDGYGGTKLSNQAIEKKLGVKATTRNWKTVNALLALVPS